MRRPKEADYTSHVAYARALEAYCDGLESCELLELAAKAAGIEYGWQHIFSDYERSTADKRDWNPLDDDGDALRMGITLNFMIEVVEQQQKIIVWDIDEKRTYVYWGDLTWAEAKDRFEATRLAIVRAASEIGKAMP